MEGKIYQSIIAVMEDVGAIGKDKKNQQQNFMYRGVDDVMNALNPAFIKHKIFMVPQVVEHHREDRVSAQGKALIYSVCTMKYTVYADDGSFVETITAGEAMDSGDKSMNKAMATAFKYACFQLFCIPTEEMSDAENNAKPIDPDSESHELSNKQGKQQKTSQQQKLSKSKAEAVYKELVRTGVGKNSLLKNYNVSAIEFMTPEQYEDAMKTLKSKPDKAADPATIPPDDSDNGLPWK